MYQEPIVSLCSDKYSRIQLEEQYMLYYIRFPSVLCLMVVVSFLMSAGNVGIWKMYIRAWIDLLISVFI